MNAVKRKRWEIHNGTFLKQSGTSLFSTLPLYTWLEYVGVRAFSACQHWLKESRIQVRYTISLVKSEDCQTWKNASRVRRRLLILTWKIRTWHKDTRGLKKAEPNRTFRKHIFFKRRIWYVTDTSHSAAFHREISRSPFNIGIANTLLGHIGFFHFVNVYFCFRHASITDGAFVAESGRSIHGSSASVLGEAAQYRTEGRIRLLKRHYWISYISESQTDNSDIREHGWHRVISNVQDFF